MSLPAVVFLFPLTLAAPELLVEILTIFEAINILINMEIIEQMAPIIPNISRFIMIYPDWKLNFSVLLICKKLGVILDLFSFSAAFS